MKTSAIRRLRQKLAADETVYGLWVTLESPSVTEMAVALGMDWVVIDAEHGHLDWKEIVEHLRAAVRSDTVALVRIAERNTGLVKRALDIGADGVVVPWVESADELREVVAMAKYPPEGVRGIGAERATGWGQCFVEHAAEANDHVLVVPIIETVRAASQAAQMAQVGGVELFFFGPADFSSTAGYRGQWEGPGVAEAILETQGRLRRAGKQCGLLATSVENLHERRRQGFRMLGVGVDTGLLLRSLRGALAAVGRDSPMQASFEPTATGSIVRDRPAESLRPDRPEVVVTPGAGTSVELARGVQFECLAGAPQTARGLTTGLGRFAPGCGLPLHKHEFPEAITLLSGAVHVEVEGRVYSLKRFDNLVVPAGSAHATRNASQVEPATIHIAMATESPTRTLVERFYPRRNMPDDSTGVPGGERVVRFATARRRPDGANVEAVDYYGADQLPGLAMSGGYARLAPGGRQPAHVHEFDEATCAASGAVACVVEGRRHELRELATALQPRGRVHYFINERSEPAELLWVAAGPRPERIAVDDRCATREGNPWA